MFDCSAFDKYDLMLAMVPVILVSSVAFDFLLLYIEFPITTVLAALVSLGMILYVLYITPHRDPALMPHQ